MKILLLGANGNIGSYLFSKLKTNYEIECTSKHASTDNRNCKVLDLCKLNDVIKFAERSNYYDIFIFLVGLAHKKGYKNDIEIFRKYNLKSLQNTIEAFQSLNKMPKKIIFSSTISIYGENFYKDKYFEEDLLCPKSPYAITKLEAENFLKKSYLKSSWLLRMAPVYSDDFRLNINRRSKIGAFSYRVGSGKNKLSLCSINNIHLTIEAIINGKIPFGTYNLSDSEDYQYSDLPRSGMVIFFPRFFVKLIYYIGKLIKNNFIIENSIKLLTDNIYPSKKLQHFVKLTFEESL